MNYCALLTLGLTAIYAPACLAANAIDAVAFKQFVAALDKMVEAQSSDYYEAVQIVFDATQDESAIDAWMEKAAAKNQAAALLYVANARIAGILLRQESAKTVHQHIQLLKKAADSDYLPAIVNYSTCINAGITEAPNRSKALALLVPAAAKGSKEARFKWLQLSGRLEGLNDLNRPEVQAEIEKGNDCVMMYISMLTIDLDTRIQNLQEAAGLGNGDAYFELGAIVEKVNPKQSYTLMSKAAALHNPNAMAIVGGIESSPIKADTILERSGAEFKPEEGIRLMKLASMLGSPIAQLMLGELYFHGSDLIPQDKQRAFYHFYRAACASNSTALLHYSTMLLTGEGCQANTKLALSICQELSNRKVKEAELLYAYAHYKGIGVEEDAQKAAEILEDLAALNMPEAYVYLAFIAQKGGAKLKADPKQAELYLRMAKIDLGDKAQQLYDELMQAKVWQFKH